MNNNFSKVFKKNKYRIFLILAIILILSLAFTVFKKVSSENEIAKYDNEILIVKGNGDQLDSLTLKELRSIGSQKLDVSINNGLETTPVEGISIEQIIGKLDYNLKDSGVMVIEDDEGNSKRVAMSDVLEPGRIYLVYRIDGKPIYDINPGYGKMIIIDTATNSSAKWITNVKTLDIK